MRMKLSESATHLCPLPASTSIAPLYSTFLHSEAAELITYHPGACVIHKERQPGCKKTTKATYIIFYAILLSGFSFSSFLLCSHPPLP